MKNTDGNIKNTFLCCYFMKLDSVKTSYNVE